MEKQYVVIWIECDGERDAERVEQSVLSVLDRHWPTTRVVQNRIQDEQP